MIYLLSYGIKANTAVFFNIIKIYSFPLLSKLLI